MAIFKHPHGGFTEHGGEHDQEHGYDPANRSKDGRTITRENVQTF